MLGLDPDGVMTGIWCLRTICPNLQLQMAVLIDLLDAQHATNCAAENLNCLCRHLLEYRRRDSQYPNLVTGFVSVR
jgi:hypothetical protein